VGIAGNFSSIPEAVNALEVGFSMTLVPLNGKAFLNAGRISAVAGLAALRETPEASPVGWTRAAQ